MPSVNKMSHKYDTQAYNNSYGDFALVYDEMMKDIDYPAWATYVSSQAQRFGVAQPGPLLDLACGTGVFLELMADYGWEGTGVDRSSSMLAIAEERLKKTGSNIRLFLQDLGELELSGRYSLITCLCDSLNYITSSGDLRNILERIKRLLSPRGVFIADLSTYYKYTNILGNNTFAETFEDSAYIWLNTFDQKRKICRMELDFFLRKQGDLFRHFHEVHIQRAYLAEEFIAHLKVAGFSYVEIFGTFSLDPPLPEEERIFFVCRN